ncbi:S41 family peptidase [Pedobacter sp. UC225_61]|uniref:S41 family peptidase n=1 Tax=Pedobacter sp. UC225_61 TaxID=3374623 RepID=UPI003792106B
MQKYLLPLLLLITNACSAQTSINGNFESIDSKTNKPAGWTYGFDKAQELAYLIKLDSTIKKEGNYSFSIERKGKEANNGVIDYSIPNNYEGKVIDLVGYMKTEAVANGFAGLWLKLNDQDGQMIKVDYMQKQAITGTNDWEQYVIKLAYDDQVKTIHIGGLLVGDGKVWFDDLQVYIDGKKIETLKPRILSAAETDNEFNTNSKIETFVPNNQQITNLAITAQFWGFLKYHHPAVAKGNYNWDAELFRLLPSVISAKNNTDLSVALEKYLDKLPKVEVCKSCNTEVKGSTIKPNYGDLLSGKVLSKALTEKIDFILQNANIKENYYITFKGGAGNPIFQHERSYTTMKYPDAGYRILSLYRYWNMVNYFFPSTNLMENNWNAVLTSFINPFLEAKTAKEYTLTTIKLIGEISDTHTNIYGYNDVYEKIKGENITPFRAQFVENKLIVTGFYSDTLNIKNKVKLGDEILTINGETVNNLISKYKSILPASNNDALLRDLPNTYLLRSDSASLKLSVKNNIGISDINIPMVNVRYSYKNLNYTKPTGHFLLNDKIGYVYPAKYKNSDLPTIKKLFERTEGIVVDMRCYPSDFMPFTFGDYIKPVKTPFAKFTTSSVAHPGYFSYTDNVNNGGSKNTYKGKVIVIVNAESQSQAEYTTMAFQSSPNVKVLGSQTAGADGNVSQITLPGNIITCFSGLGVFYPDGTAAQRVGVKIDYHIKPTIKGIIEGKDELLEKAVSLLEKGW